MTYSQTSHHLLPLSSSSAVASQMTYTIFSHLTSYVNMRCALRRSVGPFPNVDNVVQVGTALVRIAADQSYRRQAMSHTLNR